MSSTRLPDKVLRPILDRPMLGWQIDRIKRSRAIDRLVVATSEEPSDDAIQAFCDGNGVACIGARCTTCWRASTAQLRPSALPKTSSG